RADQPPPQAADLLREDQGADHGDLQGVPDRPESRCQAFRAAAVKTSSRWRHLFCSFFRFTGRIMSTPRAGLMASGPVRLHPSQKGGARMRFALLAALAPAFAVQGNDAEKLFREMEKKITEAKSLRVASDIDVKDKREGGTLKGGTLKSTVALAPGNKLRLT